MPRSAAKPAERRRPREAREPPWSAAEYVECVDRLQRHGARGAPRSAAERRGAPRSTQSTPPLGCPASLSCPVAAASAAGSCQTTELTD